MTEESGAAPPRVWEKKRPVRYSREKGDEICRRLLEGAKWNRLCKEAGMPSYGMLYVWQKEHPEFAEAVRLARLGSADWLADRALEVAEGATKETVQADRLLVNTLMSQSRQADRKWGGGDPELKPQPPAEPVKRVVFYVRQFERVTGEDGQTYIREIPIAPRREEPR